MPQSLRVSTKQLAINACSDQPEILPAIYDFVHKWKPEVPEHSVRARIHEAVKEGKMLRVTEGVYFSRVKHRCFSSRAMRGMS